MSAQLGIGVRVYIGWAPKQAITPNAVGCVRGVILVGPFPPGPIANWPPSLLRHINADVVARGETMTASWLVEVESAPVRYQVCCESVLFPIDDGRESVKVERHEEVPA